MSDTKCIIERLDRTNELLERIVAAIELQVKRETYPSGWNRMWDFSLQEKDIKDGPVED